MSAIDIPSVLIEFLVLIFSLTVHESAHAWTASRFGDDTARRLGRVSLNPLVHIDPIGTVVFPLLAIIGGVGGLLPGVGFGLGGEAELARDVRRGAGLGAFGLAGAGTQCSADTDCTACAYPTAPKQASDCYCASCAATPLSKAACSARIVRRYSPNGKRRGSVRRISHHSQRLDSCKRSSS